MKVHTGIFIQSMKKKICTRIVWQIILAEGPRRHFTAEHVPLLLILCLGKIYFY